MLNYKDVVSFELINNGSQVIVTLKDSKARGNKKDVLRGVFHRGSTGILCDDDTYLRYDVIKGNKPSIVDDMLDIKGLSDKIFNNERL